MSAMSSPTDGKHHGDIGAFFLRHLLDVDGFRSRHKILPPIMFSGKAGLKKWAESNGYGFYLIPGENPDNAILVRDPADRDYSVVWVRAAYKKFRRALRKYAATYRVGEAGFQTVDADHVLARSLTKRVKDPWLALMPVPKGANRGFGSGIEKFMPCCAASALYFQMRPIHLLKILMVDSISCKSDLTLALKRLDGMLVDDETKDVFIVGASAEYLSIRINFPA
jgi:hypothetical protein